jgi:hypothetical protein
VAFVLFLRMALYVAVLGFKSAERNQLYLLLCAAA